MDDQHKVHKKLLTNSISAQFVQHTTLSNGFERWAPQHAVNTLLQEVSIAELLAYIHGQLLQLSVVCIRHAGETYTEPGRRRSGRTGGKLSESKDTVGGLRLICLMSAHEFNRLDDAKKI